MSNDNKPWDESQDDPQTDSGDVAEPGQTGEEEEASRDEGAHENSDEGAWADAAPEDDESEGESGESGDDEGEGESDGSEMSFLAHLEELRTRLVRVFIAVAVGFVACYAFAKDIFWVLMKPMVDVLEGSNFIYTYPPEAFFTYLKSALVAGFFLTSPYTFYQLWKFIAPGLYERERKYIIPIAIFTAVFFTTGALFGYFVVFPFGFEFFAGFTAENIEFTPKLSEYFGFSLKLLFAFGMVFELPIFVFFLARLGLVTAQGMRKKRKYAILIAFICSSLLTPPDPFTQLLMAGPIIVMYEFSVIVAKIFGRKKKPKPGEGEGEDEDEEAAAEQT
jgi:sec-independent protein translocase protein TatC